MDHEQNIEHMGKNTVLLERFFQGIWKTYERPEDGRWVHEYVGGIELFDEILEYHRTEFGMDLDESVIEFLQEIFKLKIKE